MIKKEQSVEKNETQKKVEETIKIVTVIAVNVTAVIVTAVIVTVVIVTVIETQKKVEEGIKIVTVIAVIATVIVAGVMIDVIVIGTGIHLYLFVYISLSQLISAVYVYITYKCKFHLWERVTDLTLSFLHK